MKTRILLTLSVIFLLGPTLLAQNARTHYTMKAYVPIQFDASNYQFGTSTWGHWNVSGMELGLNIKKKRFEQEFILRTPTLNSTTYYTERHGSVNTEYYREDIINTGFGVRYQGAYEIWKSKRERVHIVSGLGLSFNSNFIKFVSYETGNGFIYAKFQFLVFSPYIHTSLNYAFNAHWGMDFTLMYGPMAGIYSRVNNLYRNGTNRPSSSTWISDETNRTISSRLGVSYTF